MRLVLALLATAIAANAATNFSAPTQTNGTTYNALDITGFSTTGADMAGMQITGLFLNGSSIICTWAAVGPGQPNAGGCTASNGTVGFQLALDGDTFFNSFNLTNIVGSSLLSLTFDGPSGFTTFDRTFGAAVGTSGSSFGADASGSTSSNTIGAAVLYTNQLATLGNAPVGDEFATVVITFTGNGLPAGFTATWTMDTDNIGLRGGAPGSGIPEPATFGLLGASLAGLALLVRRKRRSV